MSYLAQCLSRKVWHLPVASLMRWAHCGPGFWNGVFGRSKVSQRAPSLDPMAMLSSSYGYIHLSVHACSCARVLVCMQSVRRVYAECMYSVCTAYVECIQVPS